MVGAYDLAEKISHFDSFFIRFSFSEAKNTSKYVRLEVNRNRFLIHYVVPNSFFKESKEQPNTS